jgi:hypothetical protein
MAELYPIVTPNATSIVTTLLEYFCLYGTPVEIYTDDGPEYSNSLLADVQALADIDKIDTEIFPREQIS